MREGSERAAVYLGRPTGLAFLRATRPYPQIRLAVQADGWEARQHRHRMWRAFFALSRGMDGWLSPPT